MSFHLFLRAYEWELPCGPLAELLNVLATTALQEAELFHAFRSWEERSPSTEPRSYQHHLERTT